MPAGETAFLSMKKVKQTLPSQTIEVQISLDKDSLKQLKDTGDYQVKRSQPMNTKMLVVNSGKR